MQNNYIYKDLNAELFLFSHNNGSITRNTFKDNRWVFSEEIISNVKPDFTVNIIDDEIFIFCQDIDFNVILVRGNNIEFESSILFQNTTRDRQALYVNIIKVDNGLMLIYNNDDCLYTQKLENGQLAKALVFDKFSSFRNKFYDIIFNKENNYLFYKSSENSNKLVFSKINNFSHFKYHTTNYEITDSSNLVVQGEILFTYIVKSSFSYQLFFRKANQNLEDAIIISEGQNIDNVLIFKADLIYIFFTSKNNIYYVESSDNGQSFSKVKKYKENNYRLIKAKFISNGNFKMAVNDVYITDNELKGIKILPEVYKDFYTDFQRPLKVVEKKFQESKRVIKQEEKPVVEEKRENIYYENLADLNNEDFYKILLQKKKEKELQKNKETNQSLENSNLDELEKLRLENLKLKKALKGVFY